MNLVKHIFALSLLPGVLAGCGQRSGATPSSTATAVSSTTPAQTGSSVAATVIAHDKTTLKHLAFTADRYAISTSSDGTPIIVFHSICTGSTDGHCQAVQVFRGTDSNPAWIGHYAGVTSFRAMPNGFSVTSVQYAKSDPLCCPSLPPTTMEYHWSGRRFTQVQPGSRVSP
ncbi:MAG TPA: hypothetical protein VF221_01660 [Chloroflexota bacterium]